MTAPELKVVGEIKPPSYKDPVTMLRNIADMIERGDYGDVDTIVVATAGSEGYDTFGGGKDSDMHACAFLFGAAHQRLLALPWGGE
jgi:hypothetical protein